MKIGTQTTLVSKTKGEKKNINVVVIIIIAIVIFIRDGWLEMKMAKYKKNKHSCWRKNKENKLWQGYREET